ncbi:hypothetical protein EDC96DRAFT_522604, partial [Choanephora cucurbitarum]
MRFSRYIIAFICLTTVYAQYPLHENIAHDIHPLKQTQLAYPIPHVSLSLKDRVVNYVHHLHQLVAEARDELAQNNNQRPSTQYSLDDILFSIQYYLPHTPTDPKQQESKARRHQIARILHTSPLLSRPHLTQVRNQMVDWTKTSQQRIHTHYTLPTLDGLDSLLKSAHDFVTAATDADLMVDPIFLSSGYVTLDDAVKLFLTNNRHTFDRLMQEMHQQFNDLVCLSGDLRRPLEHVRQEAMQQTRVLRDQLVTTHLEPRLQHLSWRVRHELQLMTDELRGLSPEASKVVRHHTADALLAEIETLYDLKSAVSRAGSMIQHVWAQAGHELVLKPTSVDYWVDLMEEVKETVRHLAKDLAHRHHVIQQRRKPKLHKY